MWHDTMLASCRQVWDVSHSCITLKAQQSSGILKLNCCFKPKLKLQRARAVPSVVYGGSSRNHWCNNDLYQPNLQGKTSLVCKSRTRRSPYFWQSVAVSIPAQDSRPAVTVSGSRSGSLPKAVTMTAVVTKDVDISGLILSDAGMQMYKAQEQEALVAESEKLRRHRISVANKGKVPWNKGGKHTAETIKRIKEKTSQAMQNPTVMAKLRQNARHSQTIETKVKIREKLRNRWDTKKRIRGYQESMLKEWKECVAESARMGGLGEEEMQWNSYVVIKKEMRLSAAAQARAEKKEKRLKSVKPPRALKSEEHRLKISAAIRAKWEDPEYKLKVKQGMVKNNNAIKGKRVQKRKSSEDSATSEAGCIKGPLDRGFVTAVMSGEKKRQQKQVAAKAKREDSPAVSAVKAKLRARNQKVNLLKRPIVPARSEVEDFSEDDFDEELSVSAEHSFVDPHADEKLFRLKLLQASRSVMDQRRREATQRAKVLMAEAEQAAKKLEAAGGGNEYARASLAEIYRLMAEAEQFIQAADSLHKDVDGMKSHNGALWKSTMAPYESSKFQEQTTSQEEQEKTHGRDHKNMLSTGSDVIRGRHLNQPSGQVAMGMKTTSTIRGSAEVMMFSTEMRNKSVWDVHNPYTDESLCKSRVRSTVGLLNGS